jgi:hypothetical protein
MGHENGDVNDMGWFPTFYDGMTQLLIIILPFQPLLNAHAVILVMLTFLCRRGLDTG